MCNFCDYFTSNKKDFDKHLSTLKHQNGHKSTKINKKSPKIPKPLLCECGKEYKERTGLWRHKKKGICYNLIDEEEPTDKSLKMLLFK